MTEQFHNGENLFSHIENPTIRTWNRFVTTFNIIKIKGMDHAKGYIAALDPDAKVEVKTLLKRLQTEGYDSLHKEAIRSFG